MPAEATDAAAQAHVAAPVAAAKAPEQEAAGAWTAAENVFG